MKIKFLREKPDAEWVDVTDPTLISRLGLDDNPAFEDATNPGDPCITVLFI